MNMIGVATRRMAIKIKVRLRCSLWKGPDREPANAAAYPKNPAIGPVIITEPHAAPRHPSM